jgi:hypothetical protein
MLAVNRLFFFNTIRSHPHIPVIPAKAGIH